jgi:transposase
MLPRCQPSPTASSPTSCEASSNCCFPRHHPACNGGPGRTIPDRACFAAVVFMVRTSTPWHLLPARELRCGSASTAYRRFAAWAKAGVFDALSLEFLDALGEADRIDWRRVSVDTVSLRATKGGEQTGPTPPTVARPAASSTSPPTTPASRSPLC